MQAFDYAFQASNMLFAHKVWYLTFKFDRMLVRVPVCGPFPSSYSDEAAFVWYVNDVVPDQALCVLSVGVLDQGTDTRPSWLDVGSPHNDVGAQVVVNLVKNELDVFLRRRRGVSHLEKSDWI